MASLSPNYRSEEGLDSIQALLKDLCQKQRTLASSRRDLLLRRESTRSLGTVLQSKQVEARDVEAALMSSMRQFYHEHVGSLPVSLTSLYERLETLRNAMSINQDEHEQAQRGLSGKEWAFADQEEEVYQYQIEDILSEITNLRTGTVSNRSATIRMLPPSPANPHFSTPAWIDTYPLPTTTPPLPPSPPLRHALSSMDNTESAAHSQSSLHAANAELDLLRREFGALRTERARRITGRDETEQTHEGQSFKENYFDVIGRLMKHEVKIMQLRDEESQGQMAESAITRRHSYDVPSRQYSGEFANHEARACTESALSLSRETYLPDKRTRFWLYENLERMPLQRTLYRNILEGYSITGRNDEDHQLTDQAARFWDIDNYDSDYERTDTTATIRVWEPELAEDERYDLSITDDEGFVEYVNDFRYGLAEQKEEPTASPPSSTCEVSKPFVNRGNTDETAGVAAEEGMKSLKAVHVQPEDDQDFLELPISPSRGDSCHGLAEMNLSANADNDQSSNAPPEGPIS